MMHTPQVDTHLDGLHTLGRWTGDRARATPERIAHRRSGCSRMLHASSRSDQACRAACRPARVAIASHPHTAHADHLLFFACGGRRVVPCHPVGVTFARSLSSSNSPTGQVLAWRTSSPPCATASPNAAARAARPRGGVGKTPGGLDMRCRRPVPAARVRMLSPQAPRLRDDAPALMFTSGRRLDGAEGVITQHARCSGRTLRCPDAPKFTSQDTADRPSVPQYHVGGGRRGNRSGLVDGLHGSYSSAPSGPGRVLNTHRRPRASRPRGACRRNTSLAPISRFAAHETDTPLSATRYVGALRMPEARS